jgi:hypothetical protein
MITRMVRRRRRKSMRGTQTMMMTPLMLMGMSNMTKIIIRGNLIQQIAVVVVVF